MASIPNGGDWIRPKRMGGGHVDRLARDHRVHDVIRRHGIKSPVVADYCGGSHQGVAMRMTKEETAAPEGQVHDEEMTAVEALVEEGQFYIDV